MLNPHNSADVAGAGIGIAVVALALLVIYFIGTIVLNNIWVITGMAIVGLFIAIAVKLKSDKAI